MSEAEGKIHCPKCSARVGSFSWSGTQCSCGTWVTPAISFQRARVDRKQRSQIALQKMSNQLGALSLAGGQQAGADDDKEDSSSSSASSVSSDCGGEGHDGKANEATCTGKITRDDNRQSILRSEALSSAILELTNMGFEEPLVLVALQKNDNDVNAAMMWLFSPAAMESLDADGRVNALKKLT